MKRPGATFVLLGTFLAAGARGSADEKAAPHGLGLLAGRVTDDASREKLKAALQDPRPEVRAAAVRVINVSGLGALVPAVGAALAAETDGPSSSEMIRFLGTIDRPEVNQAILDAARRLGPAAHPPLADALGRRPSAASHIPALRAFDLDESAWLVFYDVATAGAAQSPRLLGAAVLRERDTVGWRALLRALRKADVPLEPGLALEAVRSEVAEIRTAAYWSLAADADPSRPADAALAAALAATPEARAEAPVDPAAALAFELMRRAQGGAARSQVENIKAVDVNGKPFVVWEALRPVHRLLDNAERKAISSMVFGRDDILDHWQEAPRPGRPADASRYARVGTASGFPPGFVPDVMAAAGCDPKALDTILGGEVSYRADGRPREVGLIQAGKSKQCVEATRVLLASSLAPLGAPAGEQKFLLLVPDRPEFVQCLDERARRQAQPRRPDRVGETGKPGRIQEPKKTRDRRPQYPESVRARGLQGVVLLEAEIEPSGCVSQVGLLRGVDTSLDVEAIRAVSGWRYTPTLLNGEPVPVIMTITVNFKLSR